MKLNKSFLPTFLFQEKEERQRNSSECKTGKAHRETRINTKTKRYAGSGDGGRTALRKMGAEEGMNTINTSYDEY